MNNFYQKINKDFKLLLPCKKSENLLLICVFFILSIGIFGQKQVKNDEHLFPICYGNMFKDNCGYINKRGKVIVKPKYKIALDVVEDTGVVLSEKDSYLVDIKGNLQLFPNMIVKTPFTEGLAVAEFKNRFVLLSKNGKIKAYLPNDVEELKGSYFARHFSEGLAPVRTKTNIGFINRLGNFVINPSFGYADDFYGGMNSVQVNGDWALINKKGEFIIKPMEIRVNSISVSPDGIARVQKESNNEKDDTLWEYYNASGKKILKINYVYSGDFNEGLAVVSNKGKYGYIDLSGKVIIPIKYQHARDFSDATAAVRIGKKYGFINKKGVLVIKPQFDNIIRTFENGLAYVTKQYGKKGFEGYINKTGKWVWFKTYQLR